MLVLFILCLFSSSAYGSFASVAPLNIFNPYDILLVPLRTRPNTWTATVAYEGSFNARAYQADDDEQCDDFRIPVRTLQLWQCEQDAIAAFKGNPYTTQIGIDSEIFNIDDDNGINGQLVPCSDLRIDNLMLAARYTWWYGFEFSAFLPVIHAHMKNLTWQDPVNTGVTFEQVLGNNLIPLLEQAGDLSMSSWERTGVGDLAVMLAWRDDFVQLRPILRNVRPYIRGILRFPTGKKEDLHKVFAFPFGANGCPGMVAAAAIEAWLFDHLQLAVDAEFTYFWGRTETQRIKTDSAQTDLLFLTRACAHIQPGFMQHFTVLARYAGACGYPLNITLAYQYTKQLDSEITLCTPLYDVATAQAAESLDEWATHSVVAQLRYAHTLSNKTMIEGTFFVKHGFNGKRAVLFDTVGLELSWAF